MASLSDCIEGAVSTGRITSDEAKELLRRLADYEGQLRLSGGFSPDAAAREAERAVLNASRRELRERRRQASLQTLAMHRNLMDIQTHPQGAHTGLNSLLGRDITRNARYSNVDMRARAILHELHRQFAEPLEALRTKNLGLTQDKTTLRNMIRELMGTKTGDEAAARFARTWTGTAEGVRQRFNRAGGTIPFREDWGMPQWHDPRAVARVDKAEWLDFVRPGLNRPRMIDSRGLPIGDMELETLLDHAYDRIVTSGMIDLVPGRRGGAKLANRRQDSRFMVFKDGDAWLEYSDKFGRSDLFLTLTDHLDGMAHDIALLEILGPNPDLAYRTLRDVAISDGAKGVGLAYTDALWNVVSGKVDDTATLWLADVGAGLRNWQTAARLGTATLSAIADVAFIRQTTAWMGMSAMRTFHREMKLLNPLNVADRRLAVHMGLGAEAWTTRALAANRFTEVTGAGISARVADFVMRASGLSALTDAGRKAFGMDLWHLFGEHRRVVFDELPADFRREMERFGIDPRAWDDIRSTKTLVEQGAHYLSIENLMVREDLPLARRIELNNRVGEMQTELANFAVPEPDARARAVTTAGKVRGTPSGETVRFVSQFKSFPVSVILSHFYRGMNEHGTANKIAYLSSLTIGTTMMGYVAMQAKELSKGRDPRPTFDDPAQFAKTLGAAFLQGGGAGIYGDFLYSGLFGANRYGGSLLTTMSGPVPGLIFSDIPRITTGQFGDVIEGRDPKFAADMVRFTKSYTPGGSLWYARLAIERGIFDQLELLADNAAARRRQKGTVSRRKKRFQQDYWWRPGRLSPERAPDFAGEL